MFCFFVLFDKTTFYIKDTGLNPVRSLNKIKKTGDLPFGNIPYTLGSLVKKPVYPDLNERQPSVRDAGSYNDVLQDPSNKLSVCLSHRTLY